MDATFRLPVKTAGAALLTVAALEIAAAALAPAGWRSAMAATGLLRVLEAVCLIGWVWQSKPGLAAIGLDRTAWKPGLRGALAWAAAFAPLALMAGAVLRFGRGADPLTLVRVRVPPDPADAALLVVVAAIVSPVAEEICFRGILYSLLRRHGAVAAVVGSTALFAAAHAGAGIPVIQTIGGLVFACAMEKTRSLVAPTVVHVLGNLSLYGLSML